MERGDDCQLDRPIDQSAIGLFCCHEAGRAKIAMSIVTNIATKVAIFGNGTGLTASAIAIWHFNIAAIIRLGWA